MKDDKTLRQEQPELYRIAREGGTEKPGSSPLLHADAEGIFRCALCGAALFKSETKFDSGTGWPSFTEPISAEALRFIEDRSHGMIRTEVRCAHCDAHLGHVFPDGPQNERGERSNRYCINGVCLLQEKTV